MGRIIESTSPSGATSPAANNPGIYLPWGNIQFGNGPTIQGIANQEQFIEFIAPATITLGHLTFLVGTPLAGSFFGAAIYSGDGLSKLTAADGVSCAVVASTAVTAALSAQITLQQSVSYWLGWTATDGTTLTIDNILVPANTSTIGNKDKTRWGRNTVNATAGGVTLATVSNLTAVQLRIPTMFFYA
jgi:hypothetical protein